MRSVGVLAFVCVALGCVALLGAPIATRAAEADVAAATGAAAVSGMDATSTPASSGAGAAAAAAAPAAAAAGDGDNGKGTGEEAVGEVLSAQILETETLIALQQAKVDHLRRLRNHILERVAAGGSVDLGKVREHIRNAEQAARLSIGGGGGGVSGGVGAGGASGAIGAGAYADGVASEPGAAPFGSLGFDDYMVQKAVFEHDDITAVEIIVYRPKDKRTGASPGTMVSSQHLVAIATRDGNVHFYDGEGSPLATVHAGHSAPIVAMSHDFSTAPVLVTSSSDGSVHVHDIVLWRDGEMEAGKRKKRRSFNADQAHDETDEARVERVALEAAQAEEDKANPLVTPPSDSGRVLVVARAGSIRPGDLVVEAEKNARAAQRKAEARARRVKLMRLAEAEAAAARESPEARAARKEREDAEDATGLPTGDGVVATSVLTYHFRSKELVVVGTSDGCIGTFTRNGTLLSAWYSHVARKHRDDLHASAGDAAAAAAALETAGVTDGLSVSSMTRTGAMVAFSIGRRIEFVSLASTDQAKAQLDVVCVGVVSPITSLAYDTMSTALLWASTAAGDMLVFNTKFQAAAMAASSRQEMTCRLQHNIASRAASSLERGAIRTVKGYAIALAGTTLSVINATGIADSSIEYAFDKPMTGEFGNHSGAGQRAIVATAAVGPRTGAASLLAMSEEGGGKVILYESLLPYNPPVFDIGWLRTILLVGGVVVVVGYQVMKRRGSSSQGGVGWGAHQFGADAAAARDTMRYAERSGMFPGGGGGGGGGMPGMPGGMPGMGGGGFGGGMGGGMGRSGGFARRR